MRLQLSPNATATRGCAVHGADNLQTGQESQRNYLHPAQASPRALGASAGRPPPAPETLLRMHPMLAVPHPQHSHTAHTVGRLPPARTLARAASRKPRRDRRSRRNRRATSGTSAARSCRSRLWVRDRSNRSCGGTNGTGGRTGGRGERRAERGHTDRRTERREGWRGGGGAGEPWTLPGAHPQGARVLALGRWAGPHLFQALHVFEVEADVEQTQVGVDKLELGGRRPGSSCSPARLTGHPAPSPILLASLDVHAHSPGRL